MPIGDPREWRDAKGYGRDAPNSPGTPRPDSECARSLRWKIRGLGKVKSFCSLSLANP